MTYRMTRTRRALIRRALAAVAVSDIPRELKPKVLPRTLRGPPSASNSASFAHLNTPEAAARMRQWQVTQSKER